MKYRMLTLIFLLTWSGILRSQLPGEVYEKTLKEVLTEIEARHNIKLEYNENIVKGVNLKYAAWRYRTETESTLANVLYPLDLVFQKTSENVYQIAGFEYYRRPAAEGKKHLEQLLAAYPEVKLWDQRKAALRSCFLEQMNLEPLPRKTPLNPVYTPKRVMKGYTIENVAIETLPGVYLCGSLYRPSHGKGPFAAVLCPHGHFGSDDMNNYGRYRPDQQYRCATLARMGAVVFSYEMFAWGESLLQVDSKEHSTGLALTMQTLNSIRVLDFLTSLPYVDSKRIGVTAASGGGTQSFLITALDDRISVSVPVVMVSASFYGGCPCESGLPVHSCSVMGTNNAEIAAMASPRPMMVISETSDWTCTVPEIEFPYLRKVYNLYGMPDNVENVHIENEEHNYGITKRLPMYRFMAQHLKLDLDAVKDKSGNIDESVCTIEKYDSMLVFGKEGKLPSNAVKGPDAIRKVLRSLQ